jgi:hypothetical protein
MLMRLKKRLAEIFLATKKRMSDEKRFSYNHKGWQKGVMLC